MTRRTIESLQHTEIKPWTGFVPHPDLPEAAKAKLLKIKHKSFVLENLSKKVDAPSQHLICTICPHATWYSTTSDVRSFCHPFFTTTHSTNEPGEIWICDKNQPEEDETPQEKSTSLEAVPEPEPFNDPFITDLVDEL
jgi:ribosomal protein L31